MKKFSVLLIAAVFVSCLLEPEEVHHPLPLEKLGGHSDYEPETAAGVRFKDIHQAQLEALDNIFNTITEYYDENYVRSINGGAPIAFEEFSTYFDVGKTRAVTGEFGETYQVTLGEEIAGITQNFLGTYETLRPADSEVRQLPGAVYNDGILTFEGDDKIINLNNPYGALEYDLLLAEQRGSLAALTADINNVTKETATLGQEYEVGVLNSTGPNRAMYEVWTPKYGGGTVPYVWNGDITEEHKTALRYAMRDWEQSVAAVGGHIEFADKTLDPLFIALSHIGFSKLLVINSADLGGLTMGRSTVGSAPLGQSMLQIDFNTHNGTTGYLRDRFGLYRTSRHELGHTLGLKHEHQRWDRDDYVKIDDSVTGVSMDDNNYEKLNEYLSIPLPVPKIKMVEFRVGCFSFWLPVPYIEWLDLNILRLRDSYGGFDYSSIMLYGKHPGVKMKQSYKGREPSYWTGEVGKTGNIRFVEKNYAPEDEAPYNVDISENDAQTVKKIFDNYIWSW